MDIQVDVTPLYDREVTYLAKDLDDTRTRWTHKAVKKVATFKELSRIDVSQHKISMFIARSCRKFPRVPIIEPSGEQKVDPEGNKLFTIDFDDETIYDITARYVREMGVNTTDFGSAERAEMLQDSGAMYQFGWWLIGEKVLPFFLTLNES